MPMPWWTIPTLRTEAVRLLRDGGTAATVAAFLRTKDIAVPTPSVRRQINDYGIRDDAKHLAGLVLEDEEPAPAEDSTAQFYTLTREMATARGAEPPQTWPEVEREIRATLLPGDAHREVALVSNDVQGLFGDTQAMKTRANIIAGVQPDALYYGGDWFDCFSVSRFGKDPRAMHEMNLGDEVKILNGYLDQDQRLAPKAELLWIDGNHELILDKFLNQNAPQLKYLGRDLTIPGLIKADERRMKHRNYVGTNSKPWSFHGFRIQHGNVSRQVPGANTRAMWTKFPATSGVIGHSHKAEHLIVSVEGKTYEWINSGCLCRPEGLDYISGDAGWTHAVLVLYHVFGQVHTQLAIMHNYQAIVGGTLYGPDGAFKL